MPEISQAWLALIGAILGGSGLKFIEHYLSRPKIKDDTAAAFRTELREEMKRLKDDLRRAEDGEEEWRDKYYALIERATSDRMERDAALKKIQDAADSALVERHSIDEKKKIAEIKSEVEKAQDE